MSRATRAPVVPQGGEVQKAIPLLRLLADFAKGGFQWPVNATGVAVDAETATVRWTCPEGEQPSATFKNPSVQEKAAYLRAGMNAFDEYSDKATVSSSTRKRGDCFPCRSPASASCVATPPLHPQSDLFFRLLAGRTTAGACEPGGRGDRSPPAVGLGSSLRCSPVRGSRKPGRHDPHNLQQALLPSVYAQ